MAPRPSRPPAVTEDGQFAQPRAGNVDQTVMAASVKITNTACGSGSGTIIDVMPDEGTGHRALVLTCGHLFRRGGNGEQAVGETKVIFPDGKVVFAAVFWLSRDKDLGAVIIPADANTPKASVATTPTQPGEACYGVGYSTGRLLPRHGSLINGGPNVCEFSFGPMPGDSGGGVFRASDGALVAVISTRNQGSQGVTGGATGRQAVNAFLGEKVCQWFPKYQPPARPQPPPIGVQPPPGRARPPANGDLIPPPTPKQPAPPRAEAPTDPWEPSKEQPRVTPAVPPCKCDNDSSIKNLRDELLVEIRKIKGQPGTPGKDGAPGPVGSDGKDGLPGIPGKDGRDGAVGPRGPAGPSGKDGQSADSAAIALLERRLKELEDHVQNVTRTIVVPVP